MGFHAFWETLVMLGMSHEEAFLAALQYCRNV